MPSTLETKMLTRIADLESQVASLHKDVTKLIQQVQSLRPEEKVKPKPAADEPQKAKRKKGA